MNIMSFANMLLVDKNNAFVMSLFYIRNFFFMFTLKKNPVQTLYWHIYTWHNYMEFVGIVQSFTEKQS